SKLSLPFHANIERNRDAQIRFSALDDVYSENLSATGDKRVLGERRNRFDGFLARGVAVGKIATGLILIISIVFMDKKMIMRHFLPAQAIDADNDHRICEL